MIQLFSTFVGICFLRRNPQDLPAGSHWLKITIAVLLAINALTLLQSNALSGIVATVLQLLIISGIVFLILKSKGFEQRLNQTLTAIFGTNAVFMVGMLITQFFIPTPDITVQENENIENAINAASPFFTVLLIFSVWNFIINAHILRHALSTSFGKGLLWALTLSFSVLLTYMLLSPLQLI